MSTPTLEGWSIGHSDDAAWVPWGEHQDARAKILASGDGYVVALVEVEAGYGGTAHIHAHTEFLYVLDGRLRNQGHIMSPGAGYVATAGSTHTDFVAETDATYLSTFPHLMNAATIYDTLNTAIFLPWGGSRHIRRRFDSLDIHPGDHVLELGCGTDQVTALLTATGAEVVGIDRLPAMLARAQRRAPRAQLIEGDLNDIDLGAGYDHVVIAFVLHNLDTAGRVSIWRAATATTVGGRLGVLEWAVPTGRVRANAWRRFLHTLEPSPTVDDILDGALQVDTLDAGLNIDVRRQLAGGRAQTLHRDQRHADRRHNSHRTGT